VRRHLGSHGVTVGQSGEGILKTVVGSEKG
jgi:hypothetical protein